MSANNQHIMQVSELNRKVKFILESELRTVWLTGEISNFMAASSGHWYFSLKDNKSQVRCAMFKGNNRFVTIKPKNGDQILIRANVSLYEPRGDFQLIVEQMESEGDGLLKQKFEKLKLQLASKGLFDLIHKKPLPKFIETVGVVTSSNGAAIKDIISVLNRRQPNIKIIIYPTIVQGDSASVDIADMIALANQRNECDVLVVGRGGGSLEDLWAFNEVPVVNAIFQSQLPVISAVGHEIDHSLADLAADVRAATPSAAAELISQESEQQTFQLKQLQLRIQALTRQSLERNLIKQANLKHRLELTHPKRQLVAQQQRVDDLQLRLTRWLEQERKQSSLKMASLSQRLANNSPLLKVTTHKEKVNNLETRLINAILTAQNRKAGKLSSLADQLNLVSPLATIARGYSVTRDENGSIVKSVNQVQLGDTLSTQVTDGKVVTKVIDFQ